MASNVTMNLGTVDTKKDSMGQGSPTRKLGCAVSTFYLVRTNDVSGTPVFPGSLESSLSFLWLIRSSFLACCFSASFLSDNGFMKGKLIFFSDLNGDSPHYLSLCDNLLGLTTELYSLPRKLHPSWRV